MTANGWAIETVGLTKRFGSVLALDRLDLTVTPGETFGFLGPNGAGKSTTIRLLLDLIRPTAGSARVHGIPVTDVRRAHRHIGYMPGDVALWPQLTGTETLELFANLAGGVDPAYRAELLERLQLDPSRRVGTYSRGTRQKLALVVALMTRADVLLLDEPTAGLDPLMEEVFQALVREAAGRGQTVFLSSHILDEVQDLCDRVAMLREGRLVEVATLDELRRMGATVVELVVDGPVPALAGVPGVGSVEPMPGVLGGLRVTLDGPPSALLRALADVQVVRLRTPERSLEEAFLAYY
ncbi:ABC transporter ATP-binding protein [Cellulomonas sp. SG140]|uniref:ABC transporter ATP-binding protein n=1 Tax=Cellulomonas sp. SG140 TaxID=2976536 RepID=UPI0021E7111D|nr:ABC transporter ATP-binding protein [Cellulomonas sp. SG140]